MNIPKICSYGFSDFKVVELTFSSDRGRLLKCIMLPQFSLVEVAAIHWQNKSRVISHHKGLLWSYVALPLRPRECPAMQKYKIDQDTRINIM